MLTVAKPDDQTVTAYATLRADCHSRGHALGNKVHDVDRWIAATAIRLGCLLVTNDGLFADAPGLRLLTETV